MSYPVYYVEENDTLVHLFSSYDGATGASEAISGLAVTDIEIYKDGSVTQRSSDTGYTLLDTDGIDFDGITGINGFSIDLSSNADAGFFTVGPWYHVVVASVTADTQTVNFVACAFRIVSATRGMAGTALPNAAADAAGGLIISDAGGLDADAQRSDVAAILVDTGTTLDGKINTIDGIVDDILLDTAEIGAAGAGLTNINLPNQTMDIVGNITGNLSGSVGSVTGAVGSVTGAVGSVTGNVGGNVAGSVASVTAGVTLAANAVSAAALAADAGTEIAAAVLAAADAAPIAANVKEVNDVELTGTGTTGDEWGPA